MGREIKPERRVLPLIVIAHHSKDEQRSGAFVRINEMFLFHESLPSTVSSLSHFKRRDACESYPDSLRI